MLGVVKFVDDLMVVLNSVKIVESGFIFMVDEKGMINVYVNINLLGKLYFCDIIFSVIVSILFIK